METDSLELIPFKAFQDTPNGNLRADLFRKAEEIFNGPHVRYQMPPPSRAAPDYERDIKYSVAKAPGTGNWTDLSVRTTSTTRKFTIPTPERKLFKEGSFLQRLLGRNRKRMQEIPSVEIILRARCLLTQGTITGYPEEFEVAYQVMRDDQGGSLPDYLIGDPLSCIYTTRTLFNQQQGSLEYVGRETRDYAVNQRFTDPSLQLSEDIIERNAIEVILATDFTGNQDLLMKQARYLETCKYPEVRIHYP